jgi:anti-sigma B factor antagonist
MDERPQFGVELLEPVGDVAVVVVDGELDIYTAPQLAKALMKCLDEGAVRLVVDLSAVPFIDSSGLGVLVTGLKRLQPRGGSLDIVCSRANVVRTFRLTGLLGILGLHATREEAMAAASRTSG